MQAALLMHMDRLCMTSNKQKGILLQSCHVTCLLSRRLFMDQFLEFARGFGIAKWQGYWGVRQRSGELESPFLLCPFRFSDVLMRNLKGSEKKRTLPTTPFLTTVSPHDAFSAPLARSDFLVNFQRSPFGKKQSTKCPQQFGGGAKFEAKLLTKSRKFGDLSFCNFSDLSVVRHVGAASWYQRVPCCWKLQPEYSWEYFMQKTICIT